MLRIINNNRILKRIRNYIIPIKGKSTLAMYQTIIVLGEWIVVTFFVLSVFLNKCCNNETLDLLRQYLVGIVCSMVVVIITSYLQFFKIRSQIFKKFYFNVYGIVTTFEMAMDEHDLIQKDRLDVFCSHMKEEIKEYNKDAFNLLWFSQKKEEKYLSVVKNIIKIEDIVKDIIDGKNEKNDANSNRKLVDSTINSMVVLSKKEFDDRINLFIRKNIV